MCTGLSPFVSLLLAALLTFRQAVTGVEASSMIMWRRLNLLG